MGRSPSRATRQAISRGVARSWEVRREIARLKAEADRRARIAEASDLRQYRELGVVAEALLPHLQDASGETADLIEAIGEENVTARQRLLLDDLARLRVLLSGEMGRYLESPTPEAAAKLVPLINAHRAVLASLGLEGLEKHTDPDVDDYEQALNEIEEAAASSEEATTEENHDDD